MRLIIIHQYVNAVTSIIACEYLLQRWYILTCISQCQDLAEVKQIKIPFQREINAI